MRYLKEYTEYNTDLFKDLEEEGYFDLKVIPGKGICGLFRMIFTVGLVIGIGKYDYYGRYCYKHLADAKEALKNWDGNGDPEGPWIKYKGEGGERSNPNKED